MRPSGHHHCEPRHHGGHHHKSHHHDRYDHDGYVGFDHHGEHIFGAESLYYGYGRPWGAHGGAIGTAVQDSGSSPTREAVNAGSPSTSGASEPSALVTVIGGDAYATGTNTDAAGVVVNTVKDLGNVTIASGYAIFEATGTSSTHDGATAGADTFLAVSGADFVIAFEADLGGKVGNTAYAVSETAYMAVDIENWTRPNGPLVLDLQAHSANHVDGHGMQLPYSVQPLGNVAAVVAMADAQGQVTLTSALTQALTIENHFSFVSGMAMVAA